MSLAADQFKASHPEVFFLDPADVRGLEAYLERQGVLGAEEWVASASRAGSGNMNCTLRVTTDRESFIVKQSRPWVERYPQFAAPWDRAFREAEFYRRVADEPGVAALLPRLRHFDPEARLLVLEDLGVASDYTGLYRGGTIDLPDLQRCAAFLRALHAIRPDRDSTSGGAPFLSNREMRALNHAHIFVVPLAPDNRLDLEVFTPGLTEPARALQSDAAYVREVERLGREAYLADGPSLLHGDFFPGSLLKTPDGPRVIDPEFAFFGRPEFDVGVFLAHLLLSDQAADRIGGWLEGYGVPAGFDSGLMRQLTGVEIMRRLIGYAQLPLGCGLARKRQLLELSRGLVLTPNAMPLTTAPPQGQAPN